MLAAGLVVGFSAARPPGFAGEAPWPPDGAAAVGVGDVIAGGPGHDEARPIGSIAKLVTALVVLEHAPLGPGSSGPSFAITPIDEMISRQEAADGGAVMPLEVGTVVSQRMLLQTMLIASANDHARWLVHGTFGGEAQFLAAAREWLTTHDLHSIELADATGMSPATRGSAQDVLTLARLAADHPVIAEIVAMPGIAAPFPTESSAGGVRNTNELLGRFGVDGLKTGTTDASGYSIAATAPLADGSSERAFVVVLGAPSAAERDTAVATLLAHIRSSTTAP